MCKAPYSGPQMCVSDAVNRPIKASPALGEGRRQAPETCLGVGKEAIEALIEKGAVEVFSVT
jgi:predicted methyltransferase